MTILLPNYASAQSFQEEIKTKCEEINADFGEYMYSNFQETADGNKLVFRFFKVLNSEEQKEMKEEMVGCAKTPKATTTTVYVTIHKSSPNIAIKDMCLYGTGMDDLIQKIELDDKDMEWVSLDQSPELLDLPYIGMVMIRNIIKDYEK